MLFASFFGLGKNCLASCENLLITAVENLPLKDDTQIIKLQNSSSDDWVFKIGKTYLLDIKISTDGNDHYIFASSDIEKISGKEFFIITNSKDFPAIRKLHKLDDEIKIFHSSFKLKDSGFAKILCNGLENPSGKFYFEKKEEPKPESKTYSDKIYINELLPNPKETPEKNYEFVELYNSGNENVDLSGWKIKDKTGTYNLSGIITKEGYAVFYNTVTLNNSGDEIKLFNPSSDKMEVDKIIYSGDKEDYSYSFDGEDWQWTSLLTPGKANEFLDFSGDIKITALSPNPKGVDSKKEWLEIKNGTKKEINLKGWSIATGWKKPSNHPIRTDFKIKPGKSKKLTKKICAFTLNNLKDKLELRDPLGETVQKIKYDKKKGKMLDDEVFQIKGKKWNWDKSASPAPKSAANKTETASANPTNAGNPAPAVSEEELKAEEDEKQIEENIDKFTPEPEENDDTGNTNAEEFSKIKTPKNLALNKPLPSFSKPESRVLGASDICETDAQYFFTPDVEQKHWAKNLLDSFWQKTNSAINNLLLVFF